MSSTVHTSPITMRRGLFVLRTLLVWALRYIAFFWSVVWRSVAVAMSCAILAGVGIAGIASAQSWSPEEVDMAANLIGLPISVLAVTGVIFLRVRKTIKDVARPA